jgi:hypothetical protein
MNDKSSKATDNRAIWRRALFMLLFAVIYQVAKIVIFFVVVFQFLCVLISGDRNRQVLELGQGLSSYVYEILQFMTFNSERLPFPFGPWPETGSRSS